MEIVLLEARSLTARPARRTRSISRFVRRPSHEGERSVWQAERPYRRVMGATDLSVRTVAQDEPTRDHEPIR
jgi:hypothetical protein